MEQFGLIGWPIDHSLSPAIHNAGFNAEGLEYTYELIPVHPDDFDTEIRDILQTYSGLNVTTPYKQAIIPYLDGVTEAAEKIQAVNTVYRLPNGDLFGDSTDGEGFWDTSGIDGNQTVVMIGCGGAARAIMATKPEHVHLQVLNRRSANFPAYEQSVWQLTQTELKDLATFEDWGMVDVVIDATSQGLTNDQSVLIEEQIAQLKSDVKLIDLKYGQSATPFLTQGQGEKRTLMDGKAMLLGQAILSHEKWIQAAPDRDSMAKAIIETSQE